MCIIKLVVINMLLPADSYIVVNKTIITEIDKKILIDLYQPIIGNKSISLYFTFLSVRSHHWSQ